MPWSHDLEPPDHRSLREATKDRLLRYVAALPGDATQARIAKLARLSPATLSTLMRELQADGLVAVQDDPSSRRGQQISVTNLPGVAVGVELGQAHISVCVRALTSERRYFAESAESGADRRSTWLDTTVRLISDLINENQLSPEPVVSVGLGIPAPVLPEAGEVFTPAILQGWEGAKPASELSRALSAPVAIDNEANLAAFAEYLYGAGRGTSSMIYLKMSAGVGAGVLVDGRMMRGWRGMVGEIGHLSMDPAGPVCRCGNRGCLETLIGSAHLVDQAAAAHRGFGRSAIPATIEDMVALACLGDPACVRILQDAGRHIGQAIATCSIFVNPECVVLGGQLGTLAGDLIMDSARESFSSFAIKESAGPNCKIKASELPVTAPALGALAWGLLVTADPSMR
jgi:predicted NBD/HSP70 family sugar kinase